MGCPIWKSNGSAQLKTQIGALQKLLGREVNTHYFEKKNLPNSICKTICNHFFLGFVFCNYHVCKSGQKQILRQNNWIFELCFITNSGISDNSVYFRIIPKNPDDDQHQRWLYQCHKTEIGGSTGNVPVKPPPPTP